jgi:hypothetical protein
MSVKLITSRTLVCSWTIVYLRCSLIDLRLPVIPLLPTTPVEVTENARGLCVRTLLPAGPQLAMPGEGRQTEGMPW